MLGHIARFELRLLRADRTLLALALLLAAVIGYGLANGLAWTRFQRRTLTEVAAEEGARLCGHQAVIGRLERGDTAGVKPWTDPRVPSNVGGGLGSRYAVLPPAPLAALAVGQSDLYPYYARVSTRTKQAFVVNDEIENPTNLLAGRFDLAFAVIYVLPLLILALTYNLVSAEREQGTLALLLSQPVRARRVIAGKALVRGLVVLLLVLGFTLAGALVAGVELAAPGAPARLALWAGVVVLYAAFWFALALTVNALGRSSAANAVLLLGGWLLVVVLVPSAYNVAVTALRPTPSRVELTTRLRGASDAAAARGDQLLERYYQDHPEFAAGGDAANVAARAVAVTEDTERSLAPELARFDERLAEQHALGDRFRFVSPAVVTQAALYDLAGTGAHRYAHFRRQVDAYQIAWRAYFTPRVFARASLAATDYDRLPRFTFVDEPARAVAARTVPALAGLLVPTLALAALGALALRRVSLAEG